MAGERRQTGVDFARYVLCFAVATLHALPTIGGQTVAAWATVTACLCRGAVPFFFVASGYFMRVPDRWSWSVIARPLRRLLPVYIVWFLFYAALTPDRSRLSDGMTIHSLLTGGTGFHLWFIPVLGIMLAGLPTALLVLGRRATAVAAIAIAAVGLAFGTYHGLTHLPLIIGVRVAEAPLLVLAGHALASRSLPSTLPAAVMVLSLSALLILEEWFLARMSGAPFTSHDVTLMTYPIGIATFILAASLKSSAILARIAPLGRLSLGVYAAHLFFVQAMIPLIGNRTFLPVIVLAIAATGAATVLSFVVAQIRWARPLVR